MGSETAKGSARYMEQKDRGKDERRSSKPSDRSGRHRIGEVADRGVKAAKPGKGFAAFPEASKVTEPDHETISHRKIENGHIVTHSGTRKGEYFHREYFQEERPNFAMAGGKKGKG